MMKALLIIMYAAGTKEGALSITKFDSLYECESARAMLVITFPRSRDFFKPQVGYPITRDESTCVEYKATP